MEDGMIRRSVIDHRVENLSRTRDILNGKMTPPPTLEETLAAEEKRLGVKLEVKKPERSDG